MIMTALARVALVAHAHLRMDGDESFSEPSRSGLHDEHWAFDADHRVIDAQAPTAKDHPARDGKGAQAREGGGEGHKVIDAEAPLFTWKGGSPQREKAAEGAVAASADGPHTDRVRFTKCTGTPKFGECVRPDWQVAFRLVEMVSSGQCASAEDAFASWRGPVVILYQAPDPRHLYEVGFFTELFSPVPDFLLCVVTADFVRKAAVVPASTGVIWSHEPGAWGLDLLRKLRPKALIHLSDEGEGLVNFTQQYQFVLSYGGLIMRQYLPKKDKATRFSQFPQLVPMLPTPLAFDFLDATPDGKSYCEYARASAKLPTRTRGWAFVGGLFDRHAVRPRMIKALLAKVDSKRNWTDASLRKTTIAKGDVLFSDDNSYSGQRLADLYRDAKIVPSFMGHEALDCIRNYEATLAGAVPAVCSEGTDGIDNEYSKMFAFAGRPPWIMGDDCAQVRAEMERLLAEPVALNQRRVALADWFCGYMSKLQNAVKLALTRDITGK